MHGEMFTHAAAPFQCECATHPASSFNTAVYCFTEHHPGSAAYSAASPHTTADAYRFATSYPGAAPVTTNKGDKGVKSKTFDISRSRSSQDITEQYEKKDNDGVLPHDLGFLILRGARVKHKVVRSRFTLAPVSPGIRIPLFRLPISDGQRTAGRVLK